ERRVASLWPAPDQAICCLSVRSGFDLLLETLALPRGSEVLVSAITIPDMVRIIEERGLVPVPVELVPTKMAPDMEHWKAAVTPATKAILIAHLFGGQVKMEPVLEFAREHGLLVIEDCAQAFAGTSFQGHKEAVASMFSFGVIKSSTALGGAVLQVRDRQLLQRMRERQAAWPTQSRWRYLKRLAKYATFKQLTRRPICGAIAWCCRALGKDYDRWINGAARGFPGADFFRQIRHRPSSPLLTVLARRFESYSTRRWERHSEKGRSLTRTLLGRGISSPGSAMSPNTYWVFPVTVDEPRRLMTELALAGFDATQGQSMCVVQPPADRPGLKATAAEDLLARLVFLPFYPEMPPAECERMATVVSAGKPERSLGASREEVRVPAGQAGIAARP
ncbi:MAG: aminotransferase class I/II-fold pyridoxal phosphate-dependent enzyme, partial [Planctomycetaceae bacterium]|nr:aminotransferase class I/II-fold pyridoxal phosphate-dependent enzyme [Planctomycetaceae bacterium]